MDSRATPNRITHRRFHFHPNTLPEDFSSYGPMDVDGEEDLNFGREGPRVVKLPPGMPPAPPSPGLDSQEQRWD